jgi:UDP-N-acetylmuramoylalanine--D-glutamate ligase
MDARGLLKEIEKKGQRVLVVGLGVSGVETLALLERLGVNRCAVDKTSESQFRQKSKYRDQVDRLINNGAKVYLGVDGERIGDHLENVALAVLSPGVSHESPAYAALARRKIPMISELELGIQLHGGSSAIVTGSNGKSTTVSLLHHVLSEAGRASFLCGNVGVPVVSDLKADSLERSSGASEVLVVEASSYQLESCHVIKPRVGVLLNLTENHLERHGTLQRYFDAKARLFLQQDESDVAVLNQDDVWSKGLAGRLRSKVLWFGREDLASKKHPGVLIRYAPENQVDVLVDTVAGPAEEYSLAGAPLLGIHNRYNAAAVVCAARTLGITPADIRRALQSFIPLEHRIERVARPQGACIAINDSKSTTVAAAVAGVKCVLENFPTRKMTLLLGGLAKAGSWEPLLTVLEKHRDAVARVVCFGGDGRLLQSHVSSKSLPSTLAPTLKEATVAALQASGPQDVVLLSPGCASFDEFTDFEDRGRFFKKYVREFDAGECNTGDIAKVGERRSELGVCPVET